MGNSDQPHPNKYEEIVDGLKNKRFKNVTFITGAGISTSAGIPDFRSPTGIFAGVKQKYGLHRPEDLFQIDSFLENPKPFYDFCKSFSIDHCLPSRTHLFQAFLCKKGVVNKIYTQNVDALELKAGVPEDKMVFAHGIITEAACPKCNKSYDIEELRKLIMQDKVMLCDKCHVYIKPKCVFYGEPLGFSFYMKFMSIKWADLSFIIGTTLKVYPFANLPYGLPKGSWRVLVNMEMAGDDESERDGGFGFDNEMKKDLFLGGKCDETIDKLVKDVGWEDEFNEFCEKRLQYLKEQEKGKDNK